MPFVSLGQNQAAPEERPTLVWKVEWQLESTASEALTEDMWRETLESALALKAPERWLGIPFRHAWSKVNGRWKRAFTAGLPLPTGTATPFDALALEQSQMLAESRMVRKGFLNGRIVTDTLREGHRMTLRLRLIPGARLKCCTTSVNATGSGLPSGLVSRLESEWSRHKGLPLDLDDLDRARGQLAADLQAEGWFGLTPSFLTVDIDTTESATSGCTHVELRILPSIVFGDTLPHIKGQLDSISFQWHPVELQAMESFRFDGLWWRLPKGREVRGLAHRLGLEQGGIYNPKTLADMRQSLRTLPLIQDVRVAVTPMAKSEVTPYAPLHVHIDAFPSERRVMRVNGAATTHQGLGGEVNFSLADQDFRRRAEQLSFDAGMALEVVAPYGNIEEEDTENFISRILSAGITYQTDRLMPFGPDRFTRSNKPESLISLGFRDEKRRKFSRTYVQLALTERFIENPSTGSIIELRPFEVAITSSKLKNGFITELADIGSDVLTSSFESRALLGSGVRWRLKPKVTRSKHWQWSLIMELEGAGHLFHLLDPNAPEETFIKMPSFFVETANVQVARYLRGVIDARGSWVTRGKNGVFGRCFIGVASSSIDGVSVPLEKQFYVGGPNSMRGWQALGLGPGGSGAAGLRVRGDVRLEMNLEVRQYINDWVQCAVFADAGNIWMTRADPQRARVEFDQTTFLSQTAIACGVGVRLDFGYFLLRCDAGRPVKWPEGAVINGPGWRIHPAVSLPF